MSQAELRDNTVVFKRLEKEYKPIKDLNKKIAEYEEMDRNTTGLRSLLREIKTSSSLVHIYFKELGIIKYSRNELYGIMDVIGTHSYHLPFRLYHVYFFLSAALGGIIGLCMGFSLLSGAEIVYFFTLRLFTDAERSRKKK